MGANFSGSLDSVIIFSYDGKRSSQKVKLRVIDGDVLMDGDIYIGRFSDVQQGNITFDMHSSSGASPYADFAGKRWPNGTVPYVIEEEVKVAEVAMRTAMEVVTKETGIRFVERTNEEDYVSIVAGPTNKDVCYSHVGRVGGQQFLKIRPQAKGCGIARNIHELLHTVGMLHEHQRADRDDYIEIQWDNVQEEYKDFFSKRNYAGGIQTEYDFGSVMHYLPNQFAIDPNEPTITGVNGEEIEIQLPMSSLDIEALINRYEDILDLACNIREKNSPCTVNNGSGTWKDRVCNENSGQWESGMCIVDQCDSGYSLDPGGYSCFEIPSLFRKNNGVYRYDQNDQVYCEHNQLTFEIYTGQQDMSQVSTVIHSDLPGFNDSIPACVAPPMVLSGATTSSLVVAFANTNMEYSVSSPSGSTVIDWEFPIDITNQWQFETVQNNITTFGQFSFSGNFPCTEGGNYEISVRSPNQPTETINYFCNYVPPQDCNTAPPNWGSCNYSSNLVGNHNQVISVDNTRFGYAGGATFTCNDGTWVLNSGSSCTNVPETFEDSSGRILMRESLDYCEIPSDAAYQSLTGNRTVNPPRINSTVAGLQNNEEDCFVPGLFAISASKNRIVLNNANEWVEGRVTGPTGVLDGWRYIVSGQGPSNDPNPWTFVQGFGVGRIEWNGALSCTGLPDGNYSFQWRSPAHTGTYSRTFRCPQETF